MVTKDMHNAEIYYDYLDRLLNIAYTIFKWEGLPDSISERYLERTLHTYGQALFFDSELGYIALKFVGHDLNIYEEFTKYRVNTLTGHSWDRDITTSVPIYNNPQKKPTIETLKLYAEKLYECDTVIRTNVRSMKTPILITGTKNQQLTLRQLYAKYDGNEPVIYGDKGLDLDSLKVLKTDSPYIADKVTQLKHDIWSEVLTYLGLDSVAVDKKERLVVDEATSNEDHSEHNLLVMLKEREDACKKINEMYGLNVSVRLRTITPEEDPDLMDQDAPEDQEDPTDQEEE